MRRECLTPKKKRKHRKGAAAEQSPGSHAAIGAALRRANSKYQEALFTQSSCWGPQMGKTGKKNTNQRCSVLWISTESYQKLLNSTWWENTVTSQKIKVAKHELKQHAWTSVTATYTGVPPRALSHVWHCSAVLVMKHPWSWTHTKMPHSKCHLVAICRWERPWKWVWNNGKEAQWVYSGFCKVFSPQLPNKEAGTVPLLKLYTRYSPNSFPKKELLLVFYLICSLRLLIACYW